MSACSVLSAIVVQTPWYGHDLRYLWDSAKRFPGRLLIVGYIDDPCAPGSSEEVVRQQAKYGARGIRIHLLDADVVRHTDAGEASAVLEEAARLSLPISILYRDQSLHALVRRLSRRHPEASLVVDHLGHVSPATDTREFIALAARPNVFVKLSLQYQLSRTGYPWTDLHELQRELLASFGANRLLWGSNFPMHLDTVGYAERLTAVSDALPFLDDSDRQQILGGTAASLYGIGVHGD